MIGLCFCALESICVNVSRLFVMKKAKIFLTKSQKVLAFLALILGPVSSDLVPPSVSLINIAAVSKH